MSVQYWRQVIGGHGVAAALTLTAVIAATVADAAVGDKAHADVKLRDGRDAGRIEIVETVAGVLLRVKLKGLPTGRLGFHVHEVGRCQPDFKSAGGIFNPLGAKHGYLNDEGPMVGDLPNVFIGANGEYEADLLSPFVTLNKGAEESIFDADGTAVVLFDKPDDYLSEPEGNAGTRIACGVITLTK